MCRERTHLFEMPLIPKRVRENVRFFLHPINVGAEAKLFFTR